MLSCSQSLLPPDYPVVTIRHLALLIATWILARISEVVHEILQATGAAGGKEDSAQKVVVAKSTGAPTLKAGSTLPEMPKGPHAWTFFDGSNFNVRSGPNYKKNGIKKQSSAALGRTRGLQLRRGGSAGMGRHAASVPSGGLRCL